uniref:Uncharacterized protein n=1 Tax=Anguilla anguilla TaxID=7936 RepID=A0A0E9P532_ANGAN
MTTKQDRCAVLQIQFISKVHYCYDPFLICICSTRMVSICLF